MKFNMAILLLLISTPTRADISSEKPMNHFFNAYLLEENEVQISIFTNGKYGYTDELEIGTNLLMMTSSPNISFKHKMFGSNNFQTSATGHIFKINPGTFFTDPTTIALAGFTTSNRLSAETIINWGLFDAFVKSKGDESDLEFHSFIPSLGVDHILSVNLGISAHVLVPAYTSISLESQAGDISANTNLNESASAPVVGFATMTYSDTMFNAEFGWMFIGPQTNIYANLFWKFKT